MKSGTVSTLSFLALIVVLWVFPRFWYNRADAGQGSYWLAEQEQVDGFTYKAVPANASAERVLVADRLVSGELTDPAGHTVRVFSAKRYREKLNDIGLFVHTPDRCWTESGSKIEPAAPDMIELSVHQVPLKLERRIFTHGHTRELVYFGGLVGGQALPYRLDHNLGVGARAALHQAGAVGRARFRASDLLLWRRLWESFHSRRPLLGPKQFVRVSTEIHGGHTQAADALLQRVLSAWLQPVDYRQELERWAGSVKGR